VLGDFGSDNASQPRRDDEETIGASRTCGEQRCIKIGGAGYWMGCQIDTEGFSAAPRKCYFAIEMLGIKYYSNTPYAGCNFLEFLHPLGCHFIREKCDASEILVRPSQRHCKSGAHRAITNPTDDGYAAFACLEQRLDDITANGEQKIGLLRNKIVCQSRELILFTIGVAKDDFDVAPIDESSLRDCVLQRLIDWPQCRFAVDNPPNPGHRFLCARSGHTTPIPPIPAMNSRRLIGPP
jgi:hypothetical protein